MQAINIKTGMAILVVVCMVEILKCRMKRKVLTQVVKVKI